MATRRKTDKPTQFLQIPLSKLLLLSVITSGIYQLYWFWYNWEQIRINQKWRVWPTARAIFAVIFVIPLFRTIYKQIGKPNYSLASSATLLGLMYMIASLASGRPIKFDGSDYKLDILTGVSLFVVLVALLPIQALINRSPNQKKPHTTMSTGERGIVILGVLLTILLVIGLSPIMSKT